MSKDNGSPPDPTRARLLRAGLAAAVPGLMPGLFNMSNAHAQPAAAQHMPPTPAPGTILKRPIPSTGELLPVIGCGTYIGFDVEPGTPAYQQLPGVVHALFEAGGSVLDSSPMYGRAEQTTGELLKASGERGRAFLATKVWTSGRQSGISQIERSLALLQTDRIDLLQIHNLQDWRTHLGTLRELKQRGVIRYIGITHYTSSAYEEVLRVMKSETIDFVQINYSLGERDAEKNLLPVAAERGIAVIANRPFGGGQLFGSLRRQPLPAWARDIGANSWAQVLLKFVLAQPALTCAIPGTSKLAYMIDNASAGMGDIPPPSFWAQGAHRIDI